MNDELTQALTFDDPSHSYRLGGSLIPSVTWILKDNGFIDPDFYTEEGRIRGTRVHLLCDFFDLNDYDPREAERFGLAGYVESWRKLKQRLAIEIIDIEKRLVDRSLRFAGTMDRTAILGGNNKFWIIDLKSGCPEKWHGLQLSAYEQLLLSNGESGPFRRAGVYLKEDGSMASFLEYDGASDRNYFISMLTVSNLRRSFKVSKNLL